MWWQLFCTYRFYTQTQIAALSFITCSWRIRCLIHASNGLWHGLIIVSTMLHFECQNLIYKAPRHVTPPWAYSNNMNSRLLRWYVIMSWQEQIMKITLFLSYHIISYHISLFSQNMLKIHKHRHVKGENSQKATRGQKRAITQLRENTSNLPTKESN